MGPAGMKTAGRCPKASAAISKPGTILSQMPRNTAASNMLCDSAMPALMAMASREKSDSSMPACPWVTPSHMAGTPPATCATPPASRAAWRMSSGKRS